MAKKTSMRIAFASKIKKTGRRMERLGLLIKGSENDFKKAARYLASWPIVDRKLAKIMMGRQLARAMEEIQRGGTVVFK